VIETRTGLAARPFPAATSGPPGPAVAWQVAASPVGYEAALTAMEARVAAIAAGSTAELVWLIEHPPLYTAGTSARACELVEPRFALFAAGRGGGMTYHGPGQRIAYVMLDLRRRGCDVRRFVADLEEWLIRALAILGVAGERREERVGVWVRRPDKGEGCEDKIAAIGVRIKRWISLHGVSLNVDPDLAHFDGIVPCGVSDPRYGVTSLADLGRKASLADADRALQQAFAAVFGDG